MSDTELKRVQLNDFRPVAKDVLETLPISLIRQKKIIPLEKRGGRLTAAIPQMEGSIKPQGLQMIAHCPVDLVLAPLEEIIVFINEHYGAELGTNAVLPGTPGLPGSITKALDEALQNKASELILEVATQNVRVRQRIRGVLVTDLQNPLSLPETGEIFDCVSKNGTSQKITDVRWTEWHFVHSFHGDVFYCSALLSETKDFQNLTVRLNSAKDKFFSPNSWGMGPHQGQILEKLLQRKQGLLLFCGLDSDDFLGNLRACAKELATPERHVISVSDSIREWFPGVEQLISESDPNAFLSFLRVAVKHEPDVLLVDPLEGAQIIEFCLRGALRGPLILSHAYAHDAAEALVSILTQNVEPALVGSSLLGIVAQRSLRLTCPRCQEKDPIHRDRVRDMGIPVAMQPPAFYRGKGCDACLKTGFDRECSIFEVVEMNDELRGRLSPNLKAEDVRALLKSTGLMSLRQVAIHKAVNGQTSLAEVIRVAP